MVGACSACMAKQHSTIMISNPAMVSSVQKFFKKFKEAFQSMQNYHKIFLLHRDSY